MTAKPKTDKRDRTWTRYTGIGVEYAAALAGFGLVGFWIDRHYGCKPWGVVIGAALGLIGGTYNLIRQSTAAFRRFEKDETTPSNDDTHNGVP